MAISIDEIKNNIMISLELQKQIELQLHDNSDLKLCSFASLLEDANTNIEEWISSLYRLIDLANKNDTAGGKIASKLLCSIYNGKRYPFDVGSLCSLDMGYWSDAINVLKLDRLNIQEVHSYIDNGYEIFKNIVQNSMKDGG